MNKNTVLFLFIIWAAACNNTASNGAADTETEQNSDSAAASETDTDTESETETTQASTEDGDTDGSAILNKFGDITLEPTIAYDSWGENVDSIAAWRSESGETQIFITSKDNNAIGEFDLDGAFVTASPQDDVNGIIVFEDEIYLSQDDGVDKIFVYDIATLSLQRTFSGPADMASGGEHDLDICSAEKAGGQNVAWVSDDTGKVVAYNANTGEKLYVIDTGITGGLEEIEVIEHRDHCSVVIANENDAISSFGFQVWRADAAGAEKVGEFGEGLWNDDSEGLVAVTAPDGSGYLFCTEQGENQSRYFMYHFDKTGSDFTFIGTLMLEDVANTDGISAFQWAVPDAPDGMFLAIDDDSRGVAIPLHVIFDATGLGLNGK